MHWILCVHSKKIFLSSEKYWKSSPLLFILYYFLQGKKTTYTSLRKRKCWCRPDEGNWFLSSSQTSLRHIQVYRSSEWRGVFSPAEHWGAARHCQRPSGKLNFFLLCSADYLVLKLGLDGTSWLSHNSLIQVQAVNLMFRRINSWSMTVYVLDLYLSVISLPRNRQEASADSFTSFFQIIKSERSCARYTETKPKRSSKSLQTISGGQKLLNENKI